MNSVTQTVTHELRINNAHNWLSFDIWNTSSEFDYSSLISQNPLLVLHYKLTTYNNPLPIRPNVSNAQ